MANIPSVRRWCPLLLIACALVFAPLKAHAIPPTCSWFGPDNSCPPTHCEVDGVSYAADCEEVHDSGIAGPYRQCEMVGDGGQTCKSVDVGGVPAAVKSLGIVMLIGFFWVLPGVLVYRAAKARGLDARAVLGSWLVFGWLGVSYQLFKAVPRKDQLERSPSPPIVDEDVAGRMHRAAQRIADSKAAKRSR